MYKLFSERQKENIAAPEAYIYDEFPEAFRNQFITIVDKAIGCLQVCYSLYYNGRNLWERICVGYSQEKGLKALTVSYFTHTEQNTENAFNNYVDVCEETDFLDLVDYVFSQYIDSDGMRKLASDSHLFEDSQFLEDAIIELNYRFKQHHLGYEFINGKIIPKTDTVAHEQIIKPALNLLCDEDFRGSEQEYMGAFSAYMDGDNKTAVYKAEKAFESFMEVLCVKCGFGYRKGIDTAKDLIEVLEKNNFFPPYLNCFMNGLRMSLESGAPTIRNKTSGHGQGAEIVDLPDEYVEFSLNLVASNMIFLHRVYLKRNA